MKKLFISILTLGALAISSCSSDPCEGKSAATTCSGNGTLVSGTSSCSCNCSAGYIGSKCDSTLASKIAGFSYDGKDTLLVSNQAFSFVSSIASSSIPTKIILTNFGGFNSSGTIEAYANTTNSFATTSDQVIGGVTIKSGATGTVSSDYSKIYWTYTSVDANGSVNNRGTWTKK